MMKTSRLVLSLLALLVFAGVAGIVHDVEARAGGGRSFGGSGSRSYGAPSPSSSRTAPTPQPGQTPVQPAGGGFLGGMGGGIMGGLLGGMLFSSLGFGGAGGGLGGSGIGILEIVLIGGVAYLVISLIRKRREAGLAEQTAQGSYEGQGGYPHLVDVGMEQLRRSDPSFDENRFKEAVMDTFFKIQGCWTNRDLSAGNGLLTDEMKGIFQADIDTLIRDKKSNKLENIAVRKVEVVEAWQEAGLDFVKTLFTANLLDYTVDMTTGGVVAGNRTEPVKFEEYWTFVRPMGSADWRLTAIGQA
jgi:predicted lipid-binding transport protein (Tim44 family)